MIKKLILIAAVPILGCQPAKKGALNEILPKDRVLGCYTSNTLPEIEILDDKIISSDKVIHTSYLYGRGGRSNEKLIVVMPRKLPTLLGGADVKEYAFLPYKQDLGRSAVWNVRVSMDRVNLQIISVPDHVTHSYIKTDCIVKR